MAAALGAASPALAVVGGRVYTMDRRRSAAALFAWQGRIAHLGSEQEVRALAAAAPGCRILDLAGGCAVPGFTDSHIHLLGYGLNLGRVALGGARSLDEVLRRVGAAARAAAPGAWVEGWGWDHSLWEVPRFPDRASLDRVAPQVPVALRRKDGHLLWLNSAALAAARIGPATADPPGGRIGRTPAGDPDGLLFERAQELAAGAIPPPTEGEAAAALRRAQAALHRLGVVGAHIPEGALTLRALQCLDAAGELRLRATAMLPHSGLAAALELGLRQGLGNDRLRLGPVKLFMDGSLGSETAALLAPFEQPAGGPNLGILILGPEEVRQAVERAARGGLACAVHAIGDRANRVVLDAFAATRGVWGPAGLRQRVEHAQLLHPDDLPRFAALGVIASVQPIHATQDKDLVDRLWGARGRYAYAFRSLLDSGAVLAFGSDAPVETPDPLAGLYAAVTRRRAERWEPEGRGGAPAGRAGGEREPDGAWYPEERLTVEETVRAYTLGGAVAAGLEAHSGTLAPGKWTDLTALSRDVFSEPAEALLATKVTYTVVAGEVVYSSGE